MIGLFQRINFFKGLFLKQNDWQKEQEYHMEKQRFHNKYLHSPGVVLNCLEGLRVSVTDNGKIFRIAPGFAIDGEGRDLYVPETKEILVPYLQSFNPPTTIYISIRYTENLQDRRENTANPDFSGYSRVSEDTIIEITADKPDNHTCIELGRVQLSENPTHIRNSLSQAVPGKAVMPMPIKGGRPGDGKSLIPASLRRSQQQTDGTDFLPKGIINPPGLDELDLTHIPEAGARSAVRTKALTLSDLGEKLIDTKIEVIAGSRGAEDTTLLIEQYPKHLAPPMYIASVHSLDGARVRWSIQCIDNESGGLDYSLHIRNESLRPTAVACRVFRVRIY
jgi:hypothetical protein